MSHYTDKIALVTGAASGLGRALCLELASRGATIVACDINPEGCGFVVEEIRLRDGEAEALIFDVSNERAFEAAVDQTAARHGRLDLLINNAGYCVTGEARHIPQDAFRRLTEVNYMALVHGSRLAMGHMIPQGQGQIINIASVYGLICAPTASAYVATKHAVVGFSRSLRHEAADLGIKVNTVCPGFISTAFFENARYEGVPKEDMLAQLTLPFISPELAARKILDAARRDRAMIAFPFYVKLLRWMDRHAPFLLRALYRKALRDYRRLLPEA